MLHAPTVEVPSIANVTGLPEAPPVAAGVYVPPTLAVAGAAFVIVIVWFNLEIVIVFVTDGAAAYVLSPAWLAVIEQSPAVTMTAEVPLPAIVQMPVVFDT